MIGFLIGGISWIFWGIAHLIFFFIALAICIGILIYIMGELSAPEPSCICDADEYYPAQMESRFDE